LYTNFNGLKTGLTRKISLSFRFVAASRKKSFHIDVKSHIAEVKLCNLNQFAEAFSGIASCKNNFPIFHVPSFYNKLDLVDALFAPTQTHFGVGQTVNCSFINRNVLSSRYHSRGSSFSHSVVRKRWNLVKALKFSK